MLWRRGKAYSQDLRDRVLARADSGDRVGQIAKALQVSVSYVSKALSRRATAVATDCSVAMAALGTILRIPSVDCHYVGKSIRSERSSRRGSIDDR